MITRYYECTCDNCGTTDYTNYNDNFSLKQIGYIKKGKLCFCSKQCLKEYKLKNNKKDENH